jgi:hypothetical protein
MNAPAITAAPILNARAMLNIETSQFTFLFGRVTESLERTTRVAGPAGAVHHASRVMSPWNIGENAAMPQALREAHAPV